MSLDTAATTLRNDNNFNNKKTTQKRRRASATTIAVILLVFVGSQVLIMFYFHAFEVKSISSSSIHLKQSLQDFLGVFKEPKATTKDYREERTGATTSDSAGSGVPASGYTATLDGGMVSAGSETENTALSVIATSRTVTLDSSANNSTAPDDEFNVWDESTILPPWLKKYFVWHRKQRKEMNVSNFREKRFLVMQCLTHYRCGGTADRIKPLPVMLWFAARSQRILLIRWERPAPLEEFLLPPHGGLDWRVPDWLAPHIGSSPHAGTCDMIDKLLKDTSAVFVRSKYQSHNGGQPYYDENAPGANYTDVYHDIWRTVFTPAPPIARIIKHEQAKLGLTPGNYASAHFRALYARKARPDAETREWAINAVNCASELRPGGPIYFASDTRVATDAVLAYAKEHNRAIVSLVHDDEPLHIEKVENWTSHPPSDFYSTFVDLYMLGMSRCVSYNIGGFGRWGLMMSYNASCEKMHSKRKIFKCDWKDPPLEPHPVHPHNDASLRKPMKHGNATTDSRR